MTEYLAGPVKHSVTIAGHQTSLSLEPLFWEALREEAARKSLPVNALIAQIDLERIGVEQPPNLASAIRLWLFQQRTNMFIDTHSQNS
ncbi:ribbon-helix-helix domain-containing protein [Rhizorhapis suberifaciens]|uniref:Putative DNA-binding ribbon-helix-helix protein n=1 Tax=Rhizorhapis suberifaciens TaxID=13656 RepID=A0A840HS73_9SPHN|nr:ribbon-helix-helix domain-containing protein [Rhizorhapis suberifaciens]MBB4641002.1 putative DNA-binding ribbon-helix-helix protein [Rhizorhapis suberifaciens]